MDRNIDLLWTPTFTDTGEMQLDFCCDSDGAQIDLGSTVVPVIGTANDYALSTNKPKINGVELIGNKTNTDLNMRAMTNIEIENILKSFI